MIKYVIFDYGKVLGYPKSGKWLITPKFLELIKNIDINKVKEAVTNNKYLVKDDLPIKTLEQEYDMFNTFYSNILDEIGLNKEPQKVLVNYYYKEL